MTEIQPIDLRRDGGAVAILIATALAMQLPLYHRWFSLLDEAAILQIADQLNQGSILYRDAVHVAFPGIFYLTAALFRVFGPSVLVGRWLMLILFTLVVVLVYVLARTVAGRTAALWAGLLTVAYRIVAFPHWQMLSYTSVAVFLLMVAVLIIAVNVRQPQPRWPIVAGLVVGLAAVFKQDCSAFVALGIGGFLFFDGFSRRPLLTSFFAMARFGVAAAVAPILAVLAFAPAGLVGEMLWQTLWFPLVQQPVWAPTVGEGPMYIGFPPMWPPFEQSTMIRWDGFFSYFPSIILDFAYLDILRSPVFQETILPEMFVRTVYAVPYAVLGILIPVAGVRAVRRRGQSAPAPNRARHLSLLLFVGVAMIASFSRPRDLVHLMILYLPTLVLVAALVDTLAGSSLVWWRRIVLTAFAAVVGVVLMLSFRVVSLARVFYDVPLAGPRAGVRVNEDAAVAINPLVAALTRTEEDRRSPLAALPYVPAINFLTGRPLATRFFALLPLEEFSDRQEQMMADLARDPRTDTVYSLQHLASIPRPQEYAPRLFDNLVERFRLGEMFNGTRMDGWLFSILEPRPKVAEQVLFDFADHLEEATVLEIDAAGESRRVADSELRPGLEVWPFERPVIALRPAIQPVRNALSFSVDVPQSARLRLGAALNPDEWTRFLTSALRLTVRANGEAIFDTTLDPSRNFDDRRWQFADIPVAEGRTTFVFETSSDNVYGVVDNLAGFAYPRLVADGLP